MTSIFITGGTGYLGRVLVRQARLGGHHVAASYYTQAPPLSRIEFLLGRFLMR